MPEREKDLPCGHPAGCVLGRTTHYCGWCAEVSQLRAIAAERIKAVDEAVRDALKIRDNDVATVARLADERVLAVANAWADIEDHDKPSCECSGGVVVARGWCPFYAWLREHEPAIAAKLEGDRRGAQNV